MAFFTLLGSNQRRVGKILFGEDVLGSSEERKDGSSHLDCNKLQRVGKFRFPPEAMAAVSKRGNIPLLKWLKDNKGKWDRTCWKLAAQYGHIDALQWLVKNGFPFDTSFPIKAIRAGRMEVLKWLKEKTRCYANEFPDKELLAAAKGGHLEVFKWLLYQQYHINLTFTPYFLASIAKGHLEIVKWLATSSFASSPTIYPEDPMVVAVMNGQLEILKWLKKQLYSWHEKVCYGAACKGQLEVLKRLREQGCSWDSNTCKGAAGGDHLEVLKWVLENGCEWDMNTTVEGGNLIGSGRTHYKLVESTVAIKSKKVLKWLNMEKRVVSHLALTSVTN